MVQRDRIELPTRGFSDQIFENSKMLWLQVFDSILIFHRIFGFVWNRLEMFDLDGHNLGTIKSMYKRSRGNIYFYRWSRENICIHLMICSTFTQSFDLHWIGQDVTINIPERPDSFDPVLLKNLKPIDDSFPDFSPLREDAQLAFEIGWSALKSFYWLTNLEASETCGRLLQ